MVVVEMAEEQVDRAIVIDHLAEADQAGPGIDDEQPRAHANLDAGGIAAIAQELLVCHGERASDPPESDRNAVRKAHFRAFGWGGALDGKAGAA